MAFIGYDKILYDKTSKGFIIRAIFYSFLIF